MKDNANFLQAVQERFAEAVKDGADVSKETLATAMQETLDRWWELGRELAEGKTDRSRAVAKVIWERCQS